MNVNNNTSFKPNVEDIALRNQLEDWLDTQIAELLRYENKQFI